MPSSRNNVGQTQWLLRDVSLIDAWRGDVAIAGGRIVAMGDGLSVPGAAVIEAAGRVLIPALRDHHIHLLATAARLASLACGRPHVRNAEDLRQSLRGARVDQEGWIRGVNYDPGEVGELDRAALDAWVPEVPVRLQHVSGRMWCMNSAAIARLGEDGPWERREGALTGRLLDADDWLRRRLAASPPSLRTLSRTLARHGIVGVTDTGPANNQQVLDLLARSQEAGELLQDVLMMGDASLDRAFADQNRLPGLQIGAHKFHLLESALADFDAVCDQVRASHAVGRSVAFHCVSRAELVFALAVLERAGSIEGDRIEHLGICGDEQLGQLRELGLWVVSQPGFVAERGDRYRRDVDADELPWLYRLGSVLAADVPLAGSSDAPYSDVNPWPAMAAAVERRTADGVELGGHEALTPEQALAAYTGSLEQPGQPAELPAAGQVADLCLLDADWPECRQRLAGVQPVLTLRRGQALWQQAEAP